MCAGASRRSNAKSPAQPCLLGTRPPAAAGPHLLEKNRCHNAVKSPLHSSACHTGHVAQDPLEVEVARHDAPRALRRPWRGEPNVRFLQGLPRARPSQVGSGSGLEPCQLVGEVCAMAVKRLLALKAHLHALLSACMLHLPNLSRSAGNASMA